MRAAIQWTTRARPLVPEALLSPPTAVPSLYARLAALDDEALARLRGLSSPAGWIVLASEAEVELPWVDGLTYLARDPEAPALWVPTYAALVPAAPLVARALTAKLGAGPWALWGTPLVVVPLGAARTLDRARLREAAQEVVP
jgi:hypothetical protein